MDDLEWKTEFNKWMLNDQDVYDYHHTHIDYLSDMYLVESPDVYAGADQVHKAITTQSPFFHQMQEVDGIITLRIGETWATSANMMKASFHAFCQKIILFYEAVRRLAGIHCDIAYRENSDKYDHWDEIYDDCYQHALSSFHEYHRLKSFVDEANNRELDS